MSKRQPSVLGVAVAGGSVVAANIVLGATVVAGPIGFAVAAAGVTGVALLKSRKAVARQGRRAMGLASTPSRTNLGKGRPSVRGGRSGVARKGAGARAAKAGGKAAGAKARRGGLAATARGKHAASKKPGSMLGSGPRRRAGSRAAVKAASSKPGGRQGRNASSPLRAGVGRKLGSAGGGRIRRALKKTGAKDVFAKVAGDVGTWSMWDKWTRRPAAVPDTWIRETPKQANSKENVRAVVPLARKPHTRIPLAKDPAQQVKDKTMTDQDDVVTTSGLPPLFEAAVEAMKQCMMVPLFDGRHQGRAVLQVNESLERLDRAYAEAVTAIKEQARDKFPGDYIVTVYGNLAEGKHNSCEYTKQARIAYAVQNQDNIQHMESGSDMWDHSTNRR